MSIDAMHWVWEESRSKGVARHILLAIADAVRSNTDDCQAYASVRFLASRANCSNGAVTEAVALLQESKELEVVCGADGKPLKGRYGAACYRLPRAVGFVRLAVRNRSAERNDSGSSNRPAEPNDPRGGLEGDRSAERNDPVFGSAERSEPGSFRSAEHTTNNHQKTTTSCRPEATSPTAAQPGGGGQQDKPNHTPGVALISTLNYLGQWPTTDETRQLVAAAHRALAAGWTERDLRQQLDLKSGDGIRSATAVYLARLARLPAPPRHDQPAPSHIRPWCGHCNRGEKPTSIAQRTLDGPDGRPVKCVCHPGYQAPAA